jgi:hypothetical protein
MDATTLLITVYCLIDDWGWPAVGLTGAALVLNALMEEQQRPQQVTSGLLQGCGAGCRRWPWPPSPSLHGSDTAQTAGSCFGV